MLGLNFHVSPHVDLIMQERKLTQERDSDTSKTEDYKNTGIEVIHAFGTKGSMTQQSLNLRKRQQLINKSISICLRSCMKHIFYSSSLTYRVMVYRVIPSRHAP